MKKKIDELLDSNYDGIKEYDNDLPNWWKYLFILTIVWGAIYYIYYTFGPGLTSDQRLVQDLKQIEEMHKTAPTPVAASADDLITLIKDPARLAKGKAVYDLRCAACHADLGQGLVGPNLTDSYWLHGGKITDIKKTIEDGVLDKGMLAWKGILTPDEIDEVTAFLFSIKGSNPPNPKAPQGNLEN